MIVRIHTSYGDITIELASGRCESTVDNFIRYASDGFYDGTLIHRVIYEFIVQGGGFERGMIQKATRTPIQNESTDGLSNTRGTIAMARLPEDPDSATSQFFINVRDNVSLDHRYASEQDPGYCAFGRVTQGLRVVDRISGVSTRTVGSHKNVPTDEIVIERVELLR